MSATDELAAFLTARYDEAEAIARNARDVVPGSSGTWTLRNGPDPDDWEFAVDTDDGHTVVHNDGVPDAAIVKHIALHDPAAVLADLAAKRAILARHSGDHWCPEPQDPDWVVYEAGERVTKTWPCGDLRSLASAYATHPDYPEGYQ